jgi:hypothetical protein
MNNIQIAVPLNHRQEALATQLLEAVLERFPESTFLEARLSPADNESVWLYVNAPNDEEREIDLRHFAAELESEMFQEYGYMFFVKPRRTVAA